jgi:endonuclease/exonuclease/phosphatase family metal-dependent hydrolase
MRVLLGILGAGFVAACSHGGGGQSSGVTVLTRNVYVGTDVDQVMRATTPENLLERVDAAWQMLAATDFAERAAALADEIADARPHLIGLQEITVIRIQSPGDAAAGGTVPAEDEVWDYLAILMDALAERGLSYQVAGVIQESDVEIPRGNATFDDVRVTDYDVVLARSDVAVSDVEAANYAATLAVPTPVGDIELRRGWVALDARVGGETYRFVSTHLEPADHTDRVQAAQVAELLDVLADESLPIILVGDLNTRADGNGTPTYQMLLDAGFEDAWTSGGDPGAAGTTCCHDLDLRNASPQLDERIDFVLIRNAERVVIEAWVVGDELTDRTPSGLWPSDHAGVAARIRAP